jgi:hypothetical protein
MQSVFSSWDRDGREIFIAFSKGWVPPFLEAYVIKIHDDFPSIHPNEK